jgi:hypothetical protein
MSYLERLRNFKNTLPPVPTKPTEPGFVGFVGSPPGPFQNENGQVPAASSPVKHARRRVLTSTPPPATLPLTDGQQGPLSFLYSVLRDGVVEGGVFISQGIRSEPEALECLRRRYPGLKVQWARVVTHRVCGGCRFYTAAVLCNADRSPDYAAVVGSCGGYKRAGEL